MSDVVWYRGNEFWSSKWGIMLWQHLIVEEMRAEGVGEEWKKEMLADWDVQAHEYFGPPFPKFDEYLTDDGRREWCVGLFRRVLEKVEAKPKMLSEDAMKRMRLGGGVAAVWKRGEFPLAEALSTGRAFVRLLEGTLDFEEYNRDSWEQVTPECPK